MDKACQPFPSRGKPVEFWFHWKTVHHLAVGSVGCGPRSSGAAIQPGFLASPAGRIFHPVGQKHQCELGPGFHARITCWVPSLEPCNHDGSQTKQARPQGQRTRTDDSPHLTRTPQRRLVRNVINEPQLQKRISPGNVNNGFLAVKQRSSSQTGRPLCS